MPFEYVEWCHRPGLLLTWAAVAYLGAYLPEVEGENLDVHMTVSRTMSI
jgi:hypothetical protein